MKKSFRMIALIALALAMAVLPGCALFTGHNTDPEPISIPTSEPTDVPVVLDNAVLGSFIGDWYGIYSVPEARGIYAPNAHVVNDCAMRVAVNNFGKGSLFLQVNGMGRDAVSGSSNVFALCTAAINGSAIDVEGMINRQPIDWSFKLEDGCLNLIEVYGDVDNYMRIEITLVRPDMFGESPIAPAAKGYLLDNGFVGVVDLLGGSSEELPAIVAPEGCDAHIFFTSDEHGTDVPPEDDGTVTSADGHIRVTLPEGYEVTTNTVMDFVVACPEKGVRSVDFTVSAWNTDSLSFLLGNTPNVTELYHYTIDGFDFYGTFIETSVNEDGSHSTVFKLCGTDGTGCLIIISMDMDLDAYAAYTYVNTDNADFIKLILGAELFSF